MTDNILTTLQAMKTNLAALTTAIENSSGGFNSALVDAINHLHDAVGLSQEMTWSHGIPVSWPSAADVYAQSNVTGDWLVIDFVEFNPYPGTAIEGDRFTATFSTGVSLFSFSSPPITDIYAPIRIYNPIRMNMMGVSSAIAQVYKGWGYGEDLEPVVLGNYAMKIGFTVKTA